MVKKVLVVRHLDQQGDGDGSFWEKNARLSDQGIKKAKYTLRLIKEMENSGLIRLSRYAFKSSPFVRAKETMELLAEGRYTEVVPGLGPVNEEAWNFLLTNFPEAADSDTNAMFQNQAAMLLYVEGRNLLNYISKSTAFLYPGEAVILVTHSPLMEAAMAIAKGKWQPPELPISKGDIVVFNFDDHRNSFIDLSHLRPGAETSSP